MVDPTAPPLEEFQASLQHQCAQYGSMSKKRGTNTPVLCADCGPLSDSNADPHILETTSCTQQVRLHSPDV